MLSYAQFVRYQKWLLSEKNAMRKQKSYQWISPIQTAFWERHTSQKIQKKRKPNLSSNGFEQLEHSLFSAKINFPLKYPLQVKIFSSSRFGYLHYLLNPCTSITSYFSSSRQCPHECNFQVSPQKVRGRIHQCLKFKLTRIRLIDEDYH